MFAFFWGETFLLLTPLTPFFSLNVGAAVLNPKSKMFYTKFSNDLKELFLKFQELLEEPSFVLHCRDLEPF